MTYTGPELTDETIRLMQARRNQPGKDGPQDAKGISCGYVGCREASFVRVVWPENGHRCKEADFCLTHATEHWDRVKDGVAMLGTPSPVYGPPGVPIFDDALAARSKAADRDDKAACS